MSNNSTTEIWLFAINLVLSAVVGVCTAFFTIGKYKEKVDNLKTDHDKHDGKITDMKSELDRLLEFKVNVQKFVDSNIYKNQSPLSLTEYGQKLVDDSGFKEVFENTKDDLVTMLEQQNPSSQYDTQEKARALMDSLTDYAPFELLKKYAFEHGADLGQILRSGAIMLRDYYFEKHPELIDANEKW